VAEAQAAHDKFVADEVPPRRKQRDEVLEAAAAATKAGAEVSTDNVQSEWEALEAGVAARTERLSAEAATQEQAEKLRLAFKEEADKMNAFLEEQRAQAEPSGELDEQYQALSQRQQALTSKGNEHQAAVDAASAALDAAGVTHNPHTDLTATFLKAELDGLRNGLKERLDLLNKDIMAKKGQDISPEEQAEYKEVFDHFDRDQSGTLQLLELAASMRALGEDPSDQEVESIMKEFGTDGKIDFASFVKFQQDRATKTDGRDDIIESFRILAGDADYITEDQLRQVLPGEKVDYLLAHMPAYPGVEGGYAYKDWTASQYGGE